MLRRFVLNRIFDPTGVSGTGTVAHGCRFDAWNSNGNPVEIAVVVWAGIDWSVVTRAGAPGEAMDAIRRIHGHGGSTEVVWLDEE